MLEFIILNRLKSVFRGPVADSGLGEGYTLKKCWDGPN